MIVKTLDGSRPLCPQSSAATHPLHMLHTRIVDAFYSKLDRDDDGDIVPPSAAAAYHAAAYGEQFEMSLFTEKSTVLQGTLVIDVVSYYWRCGTCGFVLPATKAGE